MAAGIIPTSQITGWPNLPEGVVPAVKDALSAAGFPPHVHFEPDGVYASDVPTATNAFNTYAGSGSELQHWQNKKQVELDAFLDSHFNLPDFIRAGTATITGANVGNFLAQITNNYRNLRKNIAAATSVSQVQAIDVTSGWPSNP